MAFHLKALEGDRDGGREVGRELRRKMGRIGEMLGGNERGEE